MDDEKTILLSSLSPLSVHVEKGQTDQHDYEFSSSFQVGRSLDCDVRVNDKIVSKHHVEFHFENGGWWIRDLESTNGTFLNGVPVASGALQNSSRIELGQGGPVLLISVLDRESGQPITPPIRLENSRKSRSQTSVEPIGTSATTVSEPPKKDVVSQRDPSSSFKATAHDQPSSREPSFGTDTGWYAGIRKSFWQFLNNIRFPRVWSFFRKKAQARPGQFTRSIQDILEEEAKLTKGGKVDRLRHAAQSLHQRRSRKYLVTIGFLLCFSVALYAVNEYQRMRDAEEMFYAIKAMEIKVGMLEEKIKGQMSLKERQAFQQQRQEIQANFDDYDERIKKLGILDLKEDDLLIVKMARLFGECEIGMPEDFIKEVKKYIGYWKSSPRLTNALQMASKRGYTQTIIREMRAQNMPQHFFYLALQESNFDPKAVGPKTRVGIAKGPWQFMPKTAAEYGLKMGPLVSYRKFDPQDDRHNFLKSTRAAARHIKHLYNTKAQGSGMNIIASYNVGEGYMGKLISKMPRNPRERNFWKLLKNHKIPRETYDYVFYIFSAAVIGENPRLFGFDFNRPLA